MTSIVEGPSFDLSYWLITLNFVFNDKIRGRSSAKIKAKNVFKYTAYAGESIYSLKIKTITCKKTTCV